MCQTVLGTWGEEGEGEGDVWLTRPHFGTHILHALNVLHFSHMQRIQVAPRRALQDPASVCSILIAIGVNISPPQPVLGHRGLEQERAMTLVQTATGGI